MPLSLPGERKKWKRLWMRGALWRRSSPAHALINYEASIVWRFYEKERIKRKNAAHGVLFYFTCFPFRTESVAEKMLTNWFAFLLHKFLKVSISASKTTCCCFIIILLYYVSARVFIAGLSFHIFLLLLAGLCRRAPVHAVLRHQAADGKGAHWRHHRRGSLLPERGQAHPPADRV